MKSKMPAMMLQTMISFNLTIMAHLMKFVEKNWPHVVFWLADHMLLHTFPLNGSRQKMTCVMFQLLHFLYNSRTGAN